MLDLSEWISGGDWLEAEETADARAMPIGLFAAAALTGLRRKVKKTGRGLADLADEDRHEVRKNAKKLRYAAEFFSALYDERRSRRRYKRFVGVLEDLQDRLGVLNDLATAPDMLKMLGLTDHDQADEVLAHGKKSQIRASAGEIYDDLIDTKRFWR